MEKKRELQIFVDAGFRINEHSPLGKGYGDAGLGLWIPAIGTGVAFSATAADNNEAESLAILLGVTVGHMMSLSQVTVLTDSRANVERLSRGTELSQVLRVVQRALIKNDVSLEWRSRDVTSLADFFASLALNGKSLVATAANAKNPADKFRPLLHLQRKDKIPLKGATVNWLSLPGAPKALAEMQKVQAEELVVGLSELLGKEMPRAEFHVLSEHFCKRNQNKCLISP